MQKLGPKDRKKTNESSEKTSSPSIFRKAFNAIKSGFSKFWAGIKNVLSKIGNTLSGKKPDSNTEMESSYQQEGPPSSQYTQERRSQQQSLSAFEREAPKASEPVVRSNPSESIYDMQKRREHEAAQRELARLESEERKRDQERERIQREQENRPREEDIVKKEREWRERAIQGETARKEREQREGERIAADLQRQFADLERQRLDQAQERQKQVEKAEALKSKAPAMDAPPPYAADPSAVAPIVEIQKGIEELQKVLSKATVTKDEIRLAAAAQIEIAKKFISDEQHVDSDDRSRLKNFVGHIETDLGTSLNNAKEVVEDILRVNKKVQEIELLVEAQKQIRKLAGEQIAKAEALIKDTIHTDSYDRSELEKLIKWIKDDIKPNNYIGYTAMNSAKGSIDRLSRKVKEMEDNVAKQVAIRERATDLINKAQSLAASNNTSDWDRQELEKWIRSINREITPDTCIRSSAMRDAESSMKMLSDKMEGINKSNTIKLK